MSDNIRAAWIGASATLGAAIIAGSVAIYLGVWAPHGNANNGTFDRSNDSAEVPREEIVAEVLPVPTEKKNPEDELNNIFIGMGRSYAESLFGVAVVEIKHDFNDKIELNYSFEKFYLQMLFDEKGALTFYSVVSRDDEFTPCIPRLNKCLGDNTFAQMAQIDGIARSYPHTHIYSYLTSKHYGYGEYLYLGNAGNFKNYYLGYNSLGVDYSRVYPFVKYGSSNEQWESFRAEHKPNAFGIGDIGSIDGDNLNYEIGPEFYTFRNR